IYEGNALDNLQAYPTGARRAEFRLWNVDQRRQLPLPPVYPDKTALLSWRDGKDREHPVENAADWSRRRNHILASMQLVMGPLPSLKDKIPLDIQITEEVHLDKFTRKKLTYASSPGNRVPAYLLVPHERKGK